MSAARIKIARRSRAETLRLPLWQRLASVRPSLSAAGFAVDSYTPTARGVIVRLRNLSDGGYSRPPSVLGGRLEA